MEDIAKTIRHKPSLPKLRLNKRVSSYLSSQYESCRNPARGHVHSLPSKKKKNYLPCINLCSYSFACTKHLSQSRLCVFSVSCLQRKLMSIKPHEVLRTEDFLFLWPKHRRFPWCHPSKRKSVRFHPWVDALG